MPRIAIRPLTLALGLALAWTTPSLAQTSPDAQSAADAQPAPNSGAYLAARLADADSAFAEAVKWYELALRADPQNPDLLERVITNDLAVGAVDKAAAAATVFIESGAKNQLAYLALMADNALAGRYDQIIADQKAGHSIGILVNRLVLAWAEVGMGNMTQAQADFDSILKDSGTRTFGLYHKALALASTGDFEGADKLLSSPDGANTLQLRRAVLAHVQILSQLKRDPDAIALIDKVFGPRPDDGVAALRARLVNNQTLDFDITRNARDGLAEVFFTLATALDEQADQTYVLLYARTATVLRPDHVEAQLMTATILESLDQFDLAASAFSAVPVDDPAYVAAQIGAAEVTLRQGRVDEAVAILQALDAKKPSDINVLTALADGMRRQDKCDLAVQSLTGAIALLDKPAPGNWPLYYKRASCLVLLDQWTKAEADFRMALRLDPDQPRVLNELGYSYVDRGENLDEALKMIQRAVAAAPDQGYIIDSLAWAYYRLGRFQDAVTPQEKASQLMPVDPVVTDHLGDIYWSVGRKREAEFQWRRALSYEPEDAEKVRIQRKLDIGLDAVLAEEAAPTPAIPAPANDN